MTNEKLLTVLRGLNPDALRALIAELSKLGLPAPDPRGERPAIVRGRSRRLR